MPSNRELTSEEKEEVRKGGGISKRSMEDRVRDTAHFMRYFDTKAEGVKIEEMVSTEEGRAKVTEIFSEYFVSMTIQGGELPKKGYAEKLRSNIRNGLKTDFQFDVMDSMMFPDSAKRWKAFVEILSKEGRATVDHKEEIPGETLEAIYDLLWKVKETLEARGDESYAEKLGKVPPEYHDKLHQLLQKGAQMILTFYDVRRGKENLDQFKVNDFIIVQDKKYSFKYLKKTKSERDKNHRKEGTNVQCSGVIPFVVIGGSFNPGAYFEFFMKFIPKVATMDKKEGGWLFTKARRVSKEFNIHKEDEFHLFEANMKGSV
jgi:hypothetical protein